MQNHTEKKIRVSVIGAAGYAGGEVVRLLRGHPSVDIRMLVSGTFAGQRVQKLFPGSSKREGTFEAFDLQKLIDESEVVFMAQESGFAMKHAPSFLEKGIKVIDLSADFRLTDPAEFSTWYKMEHACPEILGASAYGLPELYREKITKAALIANPGCYPTASALALLPLIKSDLIDRSTIVIDAKSGVSGAGRGKADPSYLYAEVNESVRPYAVAGTHRHTPEIEQTLTSVAGLAVVITFTPHLIPMTRGILATCYASLKGSLKIQNLLELYETHYRNEPFVVVYPSGEYPTTKATLATNQCHLGLGIDSRTNRVTVISAIDNLVKGAAGQAVQNMNIMCGLPETDGLDFQGVWP